VVLGCVDLQLRGRMDGDRTRSAAATLDKRAGEITPIDTPSKRLLADRARSRARTPNR
jgi:hypothetical protein